MTKKKATKKDKGLLSEILKDERDKEIEMLRGQRDELFAENGCARVEVERQRAELNAAWKKIYDEQDAHAQELTRRDCAHIEATRKNQELLDSKNIEIAKLKERLVGYVTWVGRILYCDVPIQPPEIAISKVALMLEILRSSLKGATLEQAMQDLGYLETVFGFEGPKALRFFLQLVKTDRLYRHEEGRDRNPSSTQIYAIKELREHLNIGLRDAKDITDALHSGETKEIEISNREGAEKVADALSRSGYFSVTLVER